VRVVETAVGGAGDRPPRRAGIRQVAAVAGVSESTVSNVLNNPHVVTVSTRQRVERAMSEVGFVRNRAAGLLRGAISTVVGCVVLDAGNLYYAEVARGIEDRLAEAGCMHLLCSSDVRPEREARYLRAFEEHGVRGVIVSPVGADTGALAQLSRRGVPVVLLDHPQDGADLCAVTVDNVAGGRAATAHLLALGHRRIAFLRGATTIATIRQRRAGAELACRDVGLDPGRVLADVPLSDQSAGADGGPAVARLLTLRPAPTAVLCFNDASAVGLLRGLRAAGVPVPERMSVIGYDDVHFASELSPPLTTVRQPKYELGRAAAHLMLSESDAGHRHQEIRFGPELIVRRSTAAAPPR
jgi:LacI family transcriptional regulator